MNPTLLPALTLVALLGLSGCVATPRVQTTLHESPQGLVALREFADPGRRASHPATVDPAVLRRVLHGLYVQEQKALLDSVMSGEAAPTPMLSEAQIEFLTPLLVSALAQATPGEAVLFRLVQGAPGRQRATEGSLSVDGDLWHLQVVRYQAPPAGQALISKSQQAVVRAKRWTLRFRPETAVVNGTEELVVTAEPVGSESNTLAIDTARLAAAPAADPRAPGTADVPAASDASAARPDPRAQELEREVQELRRSLQDQQQRLRELEQRLGENAR